MKLLSIIALLFTFSAHAQSRTALETEAKKLSMQMKILVDRNVDRLDERDLDKLVRTFERAKDILMGRDTGPGPGPFPPVPTPRYTCDRASVGVYQSTFIKIKDFAYSGNGVNLSSSGAVNYAHDWVTKYACEDADAFISTFIRLKNFAYAGSGLNLSASAAVNYATSGVDTVCNDYAYEQEFRGLYDFAYSGRGLNMSSSAATSYARERVEPNMFRCRQFAL
ncbi:MAG: hypothetical protein CME71_05930 [Halobacteriovorax sp.]|nr:hypothetical protein [Halobacteriovorax sp.]